MWALSVISATLLIAICAILITFYIKKKNKTNSSSRKKVVSRKEFQKEKEDIKEYTSKSIESLKTLINKFIDESTIKFNDEKDHEKKKIVLEEIRNDIQLITNSFDWEKIVALGMEDDFKKYIDQLYKQRPSKWIKFDKE